MTANGLRVPAIAPPAALAPVAVTGASAVTSARLAAERRVDVHVDFLGLRQHGDTGGRCMDAPLALGQNFVGHTSPFALRRILLEKLTIGLTVEGREVGGSGPPVHGHGGQVGELPCRYAVGEEYAS